MPTFVLWPPNISPNTGTYAKEFTQNTWIQVSFPQPNCQFYASLAVLEFPQGSGFFQVSKSNELLRYLWDPGGLMASPHSQMSNPSSLGFQRWLSFEEGFRDPVRLFSLKKGGCSQSLNCWFHSPEGIILNRKCSIKSRMPVKHF